MTTVTHGRHCRCSPCAQEDWTRITSPCGMHGAECPAVYAPLGRARPWNYGDEVAVRGRIFHIFDTLGTLGIHTEGAAEFAAAPIEVAPWTSAELRAAFDELFASIEPAMEMTPKLDAIVGDIKKGEEWDRRKDAVIEAIVRVRAAKGYADV